MLVAVYRKAAELNISESPQARPLMREFGRGIVLALSSTIAILWFATVGGALVPRWVIIA